MASPKAKAKPVLKKAKAIVKKAAAKPVTKSGTPKGTRLSCAVCGMTVTVDHACGCATYHRLVCCGKPMQPKKKTA